MSVAILDIEVPRNGDWRRNFAIVDDAGAPIDLTGAVSELSVKLRAGDPDPFVATATITPVDLVGGVLEVHLSGDQFAAVPGLSEIVRLAYDFKVTQDGDDNILARGAIILQPGVS